MEKKEKKEVIFHPIETKKWRGMKYYMAKSFSVIKGAVIKVADATRNAVGYTSKDSTIYLNPNHSLYEGLTETEHESAVIGVGTHELMHQMMTNFTLLENTVSGMNKHEKKIFCELHNIMEDARIEHFADQYVGGLLLSSLKFIILHTYKTTPDLNDISEETLAMMPQSRPFIEFTSALIQFGDMGLLKGHFTESEPDPADPTKTIEYNTKEIFLEVAPLFSDFIHEPSSRKSMRICREVFEISRPLWEPHVKDVENVEEFMEAVSKALDERGKTASSGSGRPAGEPSATEGDDAKSKARKASMRELKEAMNGSSGSGSGSGQKMDATPETAEEAQEAAEVAEESAKEAAESAKEARAKADANPGDAKAEKDAEKAERNAEKAAEAAATAKAEAEASKEAKEAGDEAGEKSHAKAAGNAAKRAINSAKAASDAAEGKSGSGSESTAETAADASECASDAAESAKEAEAAAKAAAEKAEAEGTEEAKKAAEKAAKAAERAKAAAEEAKAKAEEAAEAKEAGDSEGEAKAAKAAERAAKRAEKAAEAAEDASSGEDGGKGKGEEDGSRTATKREMSDEKGSAYDTSAEDRATNGAAPDYSSCSADDYDDDEDIADITEMLFDEYELTEEDLEAIEGEVERCIEDLDKIEMDSFDDTTPLPDIPVTISRSKRAHTCLNRRITISDPERAAQTYSRLHNKLKPGISNLTSQLKRIFKNDQEEREYRCSGRLNNKRLMSSRKTVRVFDRKRSPANKANLSVLLLIDESGSMYGNRAEAAKQCAIALAETMNNCNVPCYVMGFTADTSGADAVHNHYITWKNTAKDRLKLLDITSRSNNFDGYSIRYAGEVLKKHNAEHKLMIVISDGQPACYSYRGTDGIADTKDAIRDVRKQASVLGVAIGNDSTETLHYMYGRDFLHIGNVDELFSGIAKKIARLIREWE